MLPAHLFPVFSAACIFWHSAVASAPFVTNPADYRRIEQALPAHAIVPPAKARRLLIFTLNVGYGGHPSIAYANDAFALMGRKTGAFEAVVSDDPSVFGKESLSGFDAVFFNNTVGNCFTNEELRQNLLEFITGGGGLLGVHGTSVAFTRWPGAVEDWPEFGFLIGARGANHKDSDEHVWLKVEDPGNPMTRIFGGEGFDYRDEFFRPQGTYSRLRDRVLLSIDTSKTDPNKGQARGNCYRADNDYAAAWIRNYGRGRVFYCTIAHNPYVFWDARMLQFYLAAAQFALGDLECSTTPSARLTPAVIAQEKLGWRLAAQSSPSAGVGLYDSIEAASGAGLPWLGSDGSQLVSRANPKQFGPDLTDAELTAVRLKLEEAGLRLLSHRLHALPSTEPEWRKLFVFGRKMGLETFIADAGPPDTGTLEQLCKAYDIGFALRSLPRRRAGHMLDLEALAKLLDGKRKEIGACVDFSDWAGATGNLARAPRLLKGRLLVVELGREPISERDLASFLAETHKQQLKPLFLVEAGVPASQTAIGRFNHACLNLK